MTPINRKDHPLEVLARAGTSIVEGLERRHLMSGYVPLAPVPSPWATGYFAQTATVDLQAGEAAAPDVSADEAASLPRDVPINANGLPLLNSRAGGAGTELFIDFARNADGRGTFSLDADRDNFNFAEQMAIYTCWREIVGFFSPFNVNVTTVIPPTGPSDPNFSWIQITNEWSGGNAYVNWLSKDGPKGTVESSMALHRVSGIIHEYGHNLGLNHQGEFDKYGTKTAEYSDGTGYRDRPIMGIDYLGAIRRMIVGRTTWAGEVQDDVGVVAGTAAWSNGAGGDGFRPDDFGNTIGTAFTLAPGGQQLDAFTERYNDADVFKITPTTAGPWNFTATPLYLSQAEPKLELLDASGNVIAARDDADIRNGPTNEQFLNIDLNPGTYYVRVSSGGDYAELGYYKFAATQLPACFVSNDVGVPSVNGSVTFNSTNGVFTQSGGGGDIWGASDQFRYTYATLDGNGSITARIDGLDNIGTYTKAGVMIRQSLAANSAHAFLGINPNGNIDSIRRSSTGGNSFNVNNSGQGPWVRLTRTGSTFTMERSADGTSWSTVGSTIIGMTGSVLIGLATSARAGSRYEAFSTFSNVTVTGIITSTPPTYNGLASPTGLTAAPAAGANTSIVLNWNSVAGATGYVVEQSINGVDFTTLGTTGSGVTTLTHTNPAGSMRYFYRVNAANGTAFYSVPSAIVSAINKPGAPTGMPGGFTPTVMATGATEIFLTWMDTNGETGYRIEQSTNGVDFNTRHTNGANHTVSNLNDLAPGTAYTFRITPLTNVGDGAAVPLIVNTQSRMAAVSNLRFTSKTSSSMTIAWDDSPLETGYRVERSTNGTDWTFMGDTAAGVTTWTDNNITPGGEYYYRIMPWNSTFDGIMSAAIFAAAPAASLPSGWSVADIGNVAGSGAAVESDGSWTLVSGGYDIAGNADGFNFAYRALSADGTIVARVDAVETTNNAAKAGVMIRQDLTPGSKFVAIMMNAGGGYGIDIRHRSIAGTNYTYQQALANVTAPYWLKLTRAGSTITLQYSTDGNIWTTAATRNVSFTGTFYIGLANTSFSNTLLNTSVFRNVTVGGTAPTIVSPAMASPNPASGTTTNLSVLGNHPQGEDSLSYTWSVTAKPNGAADPTYSINGTNAARNATATFTRAGNYTFIVNITNADGISNASTVNVAVQQVETGLAITPDSANVAVSTTKQFTASVVDQFGDAMVSQPSIGWSLVSGAGSIDSSGLYTAPAQTGAAQIQATAGIYSTTADISVVIFNEALAWYRFNESSGNVAADASGRGNAAILSGSSSFGPGISGNAMMFSGGHATLPSGIVDGVNDFTIATRLRLTSQNQLARIFDFGTGTSAYMYLTPQGPNNRPRFAISTTGAGGEQVLEPAAAISIPVGSWVHLAVTLSGNTARLYLNGALAATNANVTLKPSSLGATSNNYLGKSQDSQHPALAGSLDEFRIYGRALSQQEVQRLNEQTPPQISSKTFSYELSQVVTFNFSEDVLSSLESSDFGIVNLTTGQPVAGNQFTLSLQGGSGVPTITTLTATAALADGNYRVTISGIHDFGGNELASSTFDFYVLNGDINRDRRVNTLDFNILAANFGGSGKVFSQGNFNLDANGDVDSLDFSLFASRYGQTLPEPLPAAASSPFADELDELAGDKPVISQIAMSQ